MTHTSDKSTAPATTPSRQPLIVALALAALVVISFWPVSRANFVHYDDQDYVFENPQVLAGITGSGLRWAFTTYDAGNWHPLTWISLMFDVSVLGADPAIFHLVNLMWHAVNTVLVFFLLRFMTGHFWRAAFVAAAFGVHPLHVESVAWISERKDVLSAFLFLLTLWAYAKYVTLKDSAVPAGAMPQPFRERPSTWYGAAIVLFASGLMSKPMLVTVPFLLILLDAWPLVRWTRLPTRTLLLEKAPFLAMTLASCVITVIAQSRGGAVRTLEQFGIWERLGNAAVAYTRYIWKTIAPVNLAVFYPHPGAWPVALVLASVLFLGAVSWWAWRQRGSAGWLFAGWFWFLGMLVPVIGLVQVGTQSMADRYLYLPLIGLAIISAWGIGAMLVRKPLLRVPVAAMALALVAFWAAASWRLSTFWLNDETLFGRAIAVTKNNTMAHANLADYLLRIGRPNEAIPHFLEALRLSPNYHQGYNNLASALAQAGRPQDALPYIQRSLELNPKHAHTHLNMADTLVRLGQSQEAMQAYARAVQLDPKLAAAYNNWAGLLAKDGQHRDAADKYQVAVRLAPGLIPAQVGLVRSLAAASEVQGAISAYYEAARAIPQSAALHVEGARLFLRAQRAAEARQALELALQSDPGYAPAHELLRTMGFGIQPAR